MVAACVGYCKKCIKGTLAHGTARPIIGRTVKEMKVDDGKLKAVLEFCYQGLLKIY